MNKIFLSSEFESVNRFSHLVELSDYDNVIDLSQKVLSMDFGAIGFNNLVDLLDLMERNFASYEEIILAGDLLSFSSEVNVRSLFAGFIGLATSKFVYVDKSERIKTRTELLGRVFRSLGVCPLVNEDDGVTALSFELISRGVKDWSSYSFDVFLQRSIEPNRLVDSDFYLSLENAIASKVPFSLIRVNHCENRIIGQGYSFSIDEANIAYDIQFGTRLDRFETHNISSDIKKAIIGCDVIGVPTYKKYSSNKLHILEMSSYRHLYNLGIYNTQKLCHVNIHYTIGVDPRYKDLFSSCSELIAITCRDISNLEKSIGRNITRILIPGEDKFSQESVKEEHYPLVFQKVRKILEEMIRPGVVVLVGAGLLGKIYCGWIKEFGGIALDVGSLMDAIANQNTRGEGFNRKFWWEL